RADHRILCQISEGPCRRQDEHARIEPQRRRSEWLAGRHTLTPVSGSAGADGRAWSQIGPVCGCCTLTEAAAAASQAIGPDISTRDVEGNTCPQGHNEVGLPA